MLSIPTVEKGEISRLKTCYADAVFNQTTVICECEALSSQVIHDLADCQHSNVAFIIVVDKTHSKTEVSSFCPSKSSVWVLLHNEMPCHENKWHEKAEKNA